MIFINIPDTVVEYENGNKENVRKYVITRAPVTVSEYQAFQRQTGYRTVAEESGGKVFYKNELIEEMTYYQQSVAPASCMSPRDAIAFCEWTGLRLPTEGEWLAASLIVPGVYDSNRNEWPPFCDGAGNVIAEMLPWEFVTDGHEITTSVKNGKDIFIERLGPLLFRAPEWIQDESYHRREIDLYDSTLMRCFRCCKF